MLMTLQGSSITIIVVVIELDYSERSGVQN